MATEIISTVRASGGDYTSLTAWEAGEQGNLVTLDEIHTAVCYNDWSGSGLVETAGVTIDGSTTDATRYLKITVAEGHRHDGTLGSGFRVFRFDNAVFTILDDNVLIEWVEARSTEDGNGFNYAFDVFGEVTLFACLGVSSYAPFRFRSGALAKTVRAICCIAGNDSRSNPPDYAFLSVNTGYSTAELLNCVGYSAMSTPVFQGYHSAGVRHETVKNCIAIIGGTGAAFAGFDTTNSANNAATNGASVTPPGANPYTSNVTSADFVDFANANYHLVSGSGLRGAGANLYSAFTKDIDGDAWPSAGAWDIGADYYVAASGLTINSITASNITQTGARITLGLTR